MEKTTILIYGFIFFLLISIVLSSYYFLSKSIEISPKVSNLEECKTLQYNGEGKINLVFFTNKKEAEKYRNYFFNTEPFENNQNQFNFYYIDDYNPECTFYKGIAIYCHSKDLVKKSASCPTDYIIVIKEENSFIRSSTFLNVMSINSKNPITVFSHEFGHAFANLAEEYVPANKLPKNQKNCVKDCKDFLGKNKDGCFIECSKTSLYRSIENGIMRTLNSNDFGAFNKYLIESRIKEDSSKPITGRVITNPINCEKENYYLIEGNYQNNNLTIISKTIEQGCVGTNGYGDLSLEIFLENDQIIYSDEFNAELIFTATQSIDSDTIDAEVFENEGPFHLKLPIIKKSTKVEISLKGNKLKEINLKDIGARACQI